MLAQAAKFAGLVEVGGRKVLVDFDAFHIAARMIGLGRLEDAYHFARLLPFQRQLGGADSFMPWTYPPTFDLVIAPLGLLPLWLAYLLFLGPTLAAYLLVLRRLAGDAYGTVLLALFPALILTASCGQNGFLTASLIGLACLGLMRGGAGAGIPLGLMAIKPHLAACLGLYALLTRRWTVAAYAALVVAAFCAAATLAFGPSVWGAFLHGVGEAAVFLREGMYPMYRMVSVYAFLLTIGLPAKAAMAGQWIVAAAVIALLWAALRRGRPLRQVLALCALASPLVSPYAYDYDLPICGIGLALVIADILTLTTARERVLMIGLSWLACGWGLGQYTLGEALHGPEGPPEGTLSLAGPVLIGLLVMAMRVLQRDRAPAPDAARVAAVPGMAA